MKFGCVLIVIMALATTIYAQSEINHAHVKMFDPYGDDVGLIYHGGLVEVVCSILGTPAKTAKLRASGETVVEATVNDGKALLRFNITDKTFLGPYTCKGDQQTKESNALGINYRTCSDDSDCHGCDDGQFCVATAGNTMGCKINSGCVPKSNQAICPGKHDSWCEAVGTTDEYKKTRALRIGTKNCESAPKLHYGKSELWFNQPFEVTAGTDFVIISCDAQSREAHANVDFAIKYENGSQRQMKDQQRTCAERTKLDLFLQNVTVPHAFKIVATMAKTPETPTKLMAVAVVFGKLVATKNGDVAHCAIPEQGRGFKMEKMWWTVNETAVKGATSKNLNMTAPGVYQCHAKMVWKTCAPVTKFKRNITSVEIHHEVPIPSTILPNTTEESSPPPTTMTSSTTTKPPEQQTQETGFTMFGMTHAASIVVLIILILLACVLISVGVVFVVLRGRRKQQRLRELASKKSTKSVRMKSSRTDSARESELKRGPRTLVPHRPLLVLRTTPSSLPQLALMKKLDELMAVSNDAQMKTAILDDLQARVTKCEATVTKGGGIYMPAGSRYRTVAQRKDTQFFLRGCKTEEEARTLNMCQLPDFYGDRILICQAPEQRYFAPQYQAIWQEKIGVIVWIGKLKEGSVVKISPYVPLVDGNRMRCGRYYVRTILAVKKPIDSYHTYSIAISNDNKDVRELICVHIFDWPNQPKSVARRQDALANAVLHVEWQQKKQAANGLPGMLCHCSDGVQMSPSFLVTYFGYQMYQHSRCVDVMGIAEYVRRHQYCAWMMPPQLVFKQFHLIFAITETLVERYEAKRATQGKGSHRELPPKTPMALPPAGQTEILGGSSGPAPGAAPASGSVREGSARSARSRSDAGSEGSNVLRETTQIIK